MRKLTLSELFDSSFQLFYVLPNGKEGNILELLQKPVFSVVLENLQQIGDEYRLSYLYEGEVDRYPFELEIEAAEVKGRVMLLVSVHQTVHDLFQEILIEKVMPRWSRTLGLLNRLKG